jgi:hypothetical protein
VSGHCSFQATSIIMSLLPVFSSPISASSITCLPYGHPHSLKAGLWLAHSNAVTGQNFYNKLLLQSCWLPFWAIESVTFDKTMFSFSGFYKR